MNDSVLVLDFTVLVAYERDLTRRAQAVVLEALADGRLLVTAALSLAVACAELGGETRELAWLVYDRDGPLSDTAAGAGRDGDRRSRRRWRQTATNSKVAQVVHEARATSAVVLTDDPDRYTGHRIDMVDLRP